MLNKFVDLSWTINTIAAVQDGMLDEPTKCSSRREVYQINQDVGDLANKEWIIGMGRLCLTS